MDFSFHSMLHPYRLYYPGKVLNSILVKLLKAYFPNIWVECALQEGDLASPGHHQTHVSPTTLHPGRGWGCWSQPGSTRWSHLKEQLRSWSTPFQFLGSTFCFQVSSHLGSQKACRRKGNYRSYMFKCKQRTQSQH